MHQGCDLAIRQLHVFSGPSGHLTDSIIIFMPILTPSAFSMHLILPQFLQDGNILLPYPSSQYIPIGCWIYSYTIQDPTPNPPMTIRSRVLAQGQGRFQYYTNGNSSPLVQRSLQVHKKPPFADGSHPEPSSNYYEYDNIRPFLFKTGIVWFLLPFCFHSFLDLNFLIPLSSFHFLVFPLPVVGQLVLLQQALPAVRDSFPLLLNIVFCWMVGSRKLLAVYNAPILVFKTFFLIHLFSLEVSNLLWQIYSMRVYSWVAYIYKAHWLGCGESL